MRAWLINSNAERVRLETQKAGQTLPTTTQVPNPNPNPTLHNATHMNPAQAPLSKDNSPTAAQPPHQHTQPGADGKFKVGDKVEVNSRAFWYPSQIIAINGDKYRVHYDGYPSSDDEWVDSYRVRPVGGFRGGENCQYSFAGDVSPSAPFSEQLFKKKIWQRYHYKSIAGGSTAPSAPADIGVSFQTFQLGTSFTNTVSNVPGIGATRISNGAPVNATLYPVKAKFIVCEKFPSGIRRSLHDEEVVLFKDKNGQWTCDMLGVPKIVQMD